MPAPQSARLMDGTALARSIVEHSAAFATEILNKTGATPCLATVLVGDDPAPVTCVRRKQNRCAQAGIVSRHVTLPSTSSTAELIETIASLSADPQVHGILLKHLAGRDVDERAAFEAIAPDKDVDGVTMTPSQRWDAVCPGSRPAPQAESCGFSTSTTSTWPASAPWSRVAARSWASRSACCCSDATRL